MPESTPFERTVVAVPRIRPENMVRREPRGRLWAKERRARR